MNVVINSSIYRQASDYAQSQGLNLTEVIENFLVRFIGKAKAEINFKTMFSIHESHTEYDAASVVKKNLPWVHIVIGECLSGIEAIHKEVEQGFLQLYLNEYCWKFNRK